MTMELTAAIGRYGNTAALLDGRFGGPVRLRPVPVPNILTTVRAICRSTLAVDVCEMPLCSYFLARARGLAVTALPAFVVRRLPLGVLYGSTASGVDSVADLGRGPIGVRAYTDTTGVWLRGMLCRQFDVDASRIEWVCCDEEHVLGLTMPLNVHTEPGADLGARLDRGEVIATIKIPGHEQSTWSPVIADPIAATRRWIDATGAYPLSHALVVRNDVLERSPEAAAAIVDLVRRSTAAFLDDLTSSTGLPDWEQELIAFDDDPLPHGLVANRRSLDVLADLCVEQGILELPPSIGDVFVDID
jgi:4,5-dihydroxyphthalate decarboxylase